MCDENLIVCGSDSVAVPEEEYKTDPDACWDCFSQVKIDVEGATTVRDYDDFVPRGGQVRPVRSADSIIWTVKFRNGVEKRFKFPVRHEPLEI